VFKKSNPFRLAVIACFTGNISQAVVVNLTPVLFIPLKDQFGLSYTHFGLLILVNFITQVITDVAFSKTVERYGFRPFILLSNLTTVAGFLLFAFTPFLFKSAPFIGFVISTVIFSIGGGLLELLLSPIVDAVPSDGKEKPKEMALLHSAYAWGQVLVVLLTTIAVYSSLPFTVIVCIWSFMPLINFFMFFKAKLPPQKPQEQVMRIRNLLKNRVFIFAFFAIFFGASAELVMSQWSSSFMEKALLLPKIVGDMTGMFGFALTMAVSRLLYGLFGDKISIKKIMIFGSSAAIVLYIVSALSSYTVLSVIAFALTGICVSLLWPGTLVTASQKLPLAGASMFALLAAGGDIGAALGPAITGFMTDAFMKTNPEPFALRASILLACIFPVLSLIFQLLLNKKNKL